MRKRRPGLQQRWSYVVNSLQEIVPSYERASSRISLFGDRAMRNEAVAYTVRSGSTVLDLGAGPGTMSRLIVQGGGDPVLVDVSKPMLKASSFRNRVQAAFEYLPFRSASFNGAVAGFALRDSSDLISAVSEVARVLGPEGSFSICDLGKPDSSAKRVLLAMYLLVAPAVIGMVSAGRAGLKYASLYDTYLLTLRNSQLASLLSHFFESVKLTELRLGGAIVVRCFRPAR